MTLAPLLEAFDQLDLSVMPDVHALENDRAQVLWLLAAIRKTAVDCVTAAEVSNLLRDRCGVAVSRQRVAGILDSEHGTTVARIGRKNPARYKLMQKGENEVLAIDTQPLFVDPENALSSIRKVEGIFELLPAFAKQYKIPIEVRKTTGQLHDRYVISQNGMLLFGSSIKDIGKKQSIIVQLSSSFAAQMAVEFNRIWNGANKF